MNKITVSIFMLTYNQEAFIAQTIESILSQITNFKFQLVIGEDFSTDKTREICQKYEMQNPDKIKLLPSLEKNIGLIANYLRTIRECDGKYIAICDGDDYWIDNNKLQKQVDILEANVDFSIVYTKVKRRYPNGEIKEPKVSNRKQVSGFEDLVIDNFIPSVSVLFKNNQYLENVPSWIGNFPYGDWPTYLWTIKDNKYIYFLNETTAVYRTDIGESAKVREVKSNVIKVNLGILNNMLKDKTFKIHVKIIKEVILEKEINLMSSYNREKKYLKGLVNFFENLMHNKDRIRVTKIYLSSIKKSF